MKTVFIYLIHFYRLFLSPHIGNQCRFTPTCSHYTEQAILDHGTTVGVYLGLKRIICCGPWCEGGYDPVPPHKSIIQKTIER